MLFYIILATGIVSLISLIGIILIFNDKNKKSFLKALISIAAGSMLAVTFLDLLPEAFNNTYFSSEQILATVLISILFFFVFERIIHWHHCHCDNCQKPHNENKKHLAYINLLGDSIHNLIDGFLIAASFILNFEIGLAVTITVILHEIPQELSDFGILLYAGLTKARALLYNLLTALTAILGAIFFYYFSNVFQATVPLMAAFAAGNLIYLAAADLIPELQHENERKKIVSHTLWLFVGVIIILITKSLLPSG